MIVLLLSDNFRGEVKRSTNTFSFDEVNLIQKSRLA